jgi:hypothetical protein
MHSSISLQLYIFNRKWEKVVGYGQIKNFASKRRCKKNEPALQIRVDRFEMVFYNRDKREKLKEGFNSRN